MVTLAALWAELPLIREPLILLFVLGGPVLAALLAAAEARR